jgi:dihydroorotate dehydrogenase electron transfer subunit
MPQKPICMATRQILHLGPPDTLIGHSLDSSSPMPASVFVEEVQILRQDTCPGEQFILRVHAPRCAEHANPGSFVHLVCGPGLPMRRPFSLMRVSPRDGWVEILYKRIGQGTRTLSERKPGDRLSMMGPIGVPFTPDPNRPRAILIGGGVGIPPMVFLAEAMRDKATYSPLLLMGSEVPFPFPTRPSKFLVPGVPDGVIAALPLMEDLGVPSRLASLQAYAGCHPGYVTDLARTHILALTEQARSHVAIYACGPHAMLAAVAGLAKEFALPAQISLEEYMACAIGGCAGCTVPVMTASGLAMKRVCVDGPVFDAAQIFYS